MEWDYIVVGGGSAGCIVASRLADDPDARVLLLEGGERAEDNPETLRADGYREAFVNDRVMIERFSVPQAACGGRRLYLGSGRGLGGSGAVNAMVYTRGDARDFDAWGEGWRWGDLAPDFDALERELVVHRRSPTAFTETCIAAAEEAGMRRLEDLNQGDLGGVLGYEWMSFDGDDRRSAYVAFLRPRLDRPNLTVRTRARAERVLLEGRRAVGVTFSVDGRPEHARARREVIVCAGALESPKLLQLSGIGPASHLRAQGIDVAADLPVGDNLHDHPNVSLFFLGDRTVDCNYPQLYGFDRIRGGRHLAPGQPDCCFVFYPARSSFREGMMRMLPTMVLPPPLYDAGGGAFRRALRTGIGKAFEPRAVARFVARMFGVVVILGKGRSRGTVRLASPRSEDPALIDPAYFADPDDLATIVAGVTRARSIVGARPLQAWGNRELVPGPLGRTEAGVQRFVRTNAMTTYHYAGTCAMGDRGVVDAQLRVHGVEGLRVADASVMPVAPVAALNAPSMVVGWRAADCVRRARRDAA